jgi:maleylpyruvate isomerase
MYASRQARDAEIEQGATLPAKALRELVAETAGELASALAGLSEPQWHAPIVTAQGRTVQATEIPWMRSREVWIHAVDLGTGVSYDDFPPEFVDALLTDVTRLLTGRAQAPAFVVAPHDRERVWRVDLPGPSVEAFGSAAALAAWLTGRAAAPHASLPDPGPWL